MKSKNKYLFYFKKSCSLAITICLIANFLTGENKAFAAENIINKEVIERIKAALDITKALVNFTLTDEKLKSVLNTTINIGESSTNITYGLLILSALNEIDLVDLVVSQRYKSEARTYFNNVLDERLSLINYYSDVGYDLPKVLSGGITGATTALTLNTFSIINKVIDLCVAFENIRTVKLYDGLWYYLDLRVHGEKHETAWEEAKLVMGWAAIVNAFAAQQIDDEYKKLEPQFIALFNNWGVYITPSGLSQDIKDKAKEELNDNLAYAIQRYELAEKTKGPSIFDKAKLSLANLFEAAKESGKSLIDKSQSAIDQGLNWMDSEKQKIGQFIDNFGKSTITQNIPTIENENDGQSQEKQVLESNLQELQEKLDDVLERADALSQENSQLTEERNNLQQEIEKLEKLIKELLEEINDLEEEKQEENENNLLDEEKETIEIEENENSEIVLEEKILCGIDNQLIPVHSEVIINEIAWMGSTNSFSNEWIELKNVSYAAVNLKGWQILDEDKDIKVIFDKEYTIGPNAFLLLERTNDESVPQITADLIYNGTINNTNENLYLFDDNCQLQDKASASPNWVAGDNSSKRSMERKHNLEWQTSNNINGTPKQENSSGYYIQYGGGGTVTLSQPIQQDTPSPLPPPVILITEIQIGSSSSSDDDFIELFNPASTSIDISGFQLKKKTSTGNEYSVALLSEGSQISPTGYFLWANSIFTNIEAIPDTTTSQTLSKNNSVVLLNKNKNTIDAVAWGSSTNPFAENNPFLQNPEDNQSLGRKYSLIEQNYIDTDNNLDDFEIQQPTPRIKNKALISENQLPFASFYFTPQSPTAGENVVFNAASSTDPDGKIDLFTWIFGDGESTTTTRPTTTHIFTNSGNFIVKLQVADELGATSSESIENLIISDEMFPSPAIAINEIAWMGTGTSSALRTDEWIELYNTTSSDIDLNNWSLVFGRGTSTHSIIFSSSTTPTTTIPAHGFYLIERTDDETIQDITADWIGSFGHGLNNEGERIELRNSESKIIDLLDFSSGWPAGQTSPGYITMERINVDVSGNNSENWASNNIITRNGTNAVGNKINGTPKSKNSVSLSGTYISSTNTLPFNEFDELTLTYLGHPYHIYDIHLDIPENKVLNVEPGVTLNFHQNKLADIGGTIKALGKENEEIIFTSVGNNNWSGIIFKSNSPGNQIISQLNFVKINGAKRCWNINCNETIIISNYGSSLSIEDSVIENNTGATKGIWIENSTSSFERISLQDFNIALDIKGGSSQVKECSFFGNNYGIYITDNSVVDVKNNIFINNEKPIYFYYSHPFFKGNSAQDNNLNAVLIGGINSTTTLQADLTYLFSPGSIGQEGVLILEPGTIIKLDQEQAGVGGKILAIGLPAKPIIFTSIKDDAFGGDTNNDSSGTSPAPGDWESLYFISSGSIFEHSIIRYGGQKGSPWWENKGVIRLNKAVNISLKDSLVENNIYAVSFSELTSCEEIEKVIEKFKGENTVFQNNNFLTYPECP